MLTWPRAPVRRRRSALRRILLVGGGDLPGYLWATADAFPSDAFGEGPYVIYAEKDVARVLLYDDAAPRERRAAVHARARPGLRWTRAPPRPSRRPWRTRGGVDELPVAFDRGQVRAAPEVKEKSRVVAPSSRRGGGVSGVHFRREQFSVPPPPAASARARHPDSRVRSVSGWESPTPVIFAKRPINILGLRKVLAFQEEPRIPSRT